MRTEIEKLNERLAELESRYDCDPQVETREKIRKAEFDLIRAQDARIAALEAERQRVLDALREIEDEDTCESDDWNAGWHGATTLALGAIRKAMEGGDNG